MKGILWLSIIIGFSGCTSYNKIPKKIKSPELKETSIVVEKIMI